MHSTVNPDVVAEVYPTRPLNMHPGLHSKVPPTAPETHTKPCSPHGEPGCSLDVAKQPLDEVEALIQQAKKHGLRNRLQHLVENLDESLTSTVDLVVPEIDECWEIEPSS